LVVLSAIGWALGALLVLIITYPPRWGDTVGRVSAALGSLLALVVIALQIARVVAELRRQPG
jgi:hypothetical protein